MAFSINQVQWNFGEVEAVLDAAVAFSINNVHGDFGEVEAVLDEAAGVVAARWIPGRFVNHSKYPPPEVVVW